MSTQIDSKVVTEQLTQPSASACRIQGCAPPDGKLWLLLRLLAGGLPWAALPWSLGSSAPPPGFPAWNSVSDILQAGGLCIHLSRPMSGWSGQALHIFAPGRVHTVAWLDMVYGASRAHVTRKVIIRCDAAGRQREHALRARETNCPAQQAPQGRTLCLPCLCTGQQAGKHALYVT